MNFIQTVLTCMAVNYFTKPVEPAAKVAEHKPTMLGEGGPYGLCGSIYNQKQKEQIWTELKH